MFKYKIYFEVVIHLETVKEELLIFLDFIITNILCSMFQIFVVGILAIAQLPIEILSYQVIGGILGDWKIASDISPFVSYISIALSYGIIWLGFWHVLSKVSEGHIKYFYWKLAFSIIPLLVILNFFDPRPNHMAMIAIPKEPIFSSLFTSIILLPIYSILIYKFILNREVNKIKFMIFVSLVTFFVGALIFYGSLNYMDVIYSFFNYKF